MDHKDIGIALFLIGLLIFFVWAARAFVLARRREREQLAQEEEGAEPTALDLPSRVEEPEAQPEVEPDEDAALGQAPPALTAPEPTVPEGAPGLEPSRSEPVEAVVPKPARAEEPEPAAATKPEPARPAKPEPVAEAKPAPARPEKPEPLAKAKPEPAKPEPAAAERREPARPEPAKPTPEKAPKPEPAKPTIGEPIPEEKPEPALAMPKPKPKLAPKAELARPKELKAGLKKTRGGFIAKLGGIFRGKKKFDDSLLEELEEVLFTADIGVRTSEALFKKVKEALDRSQLKDADAVWATIKAEAEAILTLGAPRLDLGAHKPFVLLTVGVNGVGKTTTIGKLAAKYQEDGRRCLMAAGDTFRAAAVEQLEVWGQRVGAPVVKGKEGQDPSSVIFEAIKQADKGGFDVVICDTAGRLHTKVNLMEELEKIYRVSGKALEGAPHEILLVLDATTGQNAIQQANLFKEAVKVTGIALTKLDGTAKGGIILGICHELQIPVRYIGIGEGVEDLREFDAHDFVEALFTPAEEQES